MRMLCGIVAGQDSMANKTVITIIFIVSEIVLGTVFATLYINQYDFWTSNQSLGQFMTTVLLIYLVTATGLGILNLMAIKELERRLIIQCVLTAIAVGTVCLFIFFIFSDTLSDYFDYVELSPSLIVLVGLVAGFNFFILRKSGRLNNATQQEL
jgi:hypothetical protein